jgi:hypothetical protein
VEILAELLLFLFQLVIEVVGEAVLELGLAGIKEALGRENRSPVLAAVGYLTLGAIVGAASILLLPQRLVAAGPIPGMSLLLAPAVAGAAMEAWGRFRRRRAHVTTNLATFLGGAAFALGVALVRFLCAT